MEELKPEERELIGMLLDLGSRVTSDAIYDRIEWLVAERLDWLADGSDDLTRLYRDPRDGRLWEYERPFTGGPPRLIVITPEGAAGKYGVSV